MAAWAIASFRTFRFIGEMSRAPLRWVQWWALTGFEVRQQRKDPLTWLYALVFLLLAVGFTSGGGVELVGSRGGVPASSAWSLWLAFGGLTAFGQVITTMVAVTAVRRDDATRMADVVASSGVSPRTWLAARLMAGGLVLGVVYLAIPIGAALGLAIAVARGVEPPMALWAALPRLITAFGVLTIPTMLVVGALVGVVAAITRRTMAALGVSLVLVGCWQLALVLVAQPSTQLVGALLDPFGNAPVLAVTREWDEHTRSVRALSIDGVLVMNRLLWALVGVGGVAFGVWRVRWRSAAAVTTHVDASHDSQDYSQRSLQSTVHRGQQRSSRGGSNRSLSLALSLALSLSRFTAHWIARDGGWRVVSALAVANALLNAALQGGVDAAASHVLPLFLERITQHARVFCILLATVYAGEVLWRDRDVRVAELVDALPVSTATIAIARLAGVLWQQTRVVLPIATGALVIGAWRGLVFDLPALWVWLAWSLFHVWAPFVQWTVLSLAVHTCIRHKVGAHLLLITGWVVAFTLNQRGAASAWWYRYAEPAPLMDGSGLAWTALVVRGGSWMVVAAVLAVVVARTWPRGSSA
jgi:ABC-2 type transport system permease protein